jgi:hypothetical protein
MPPGSVFVSLPSSTTFHFGSREIPPHLGYPPAHSCWVLLGASTPIGVPAFRFHFLRGRCLLLADRAAGPVTGKGPPLIGPWGRLNTFQIWLICLKFSSFAPFIYAIKIGKILVLFIMTNQNFNLFINNTLINPKSKRKFREIWCFRCNRKNLKIKSQTLGDKSLAKSMLCLSSFEVVAILLG